MNKITFLISVLGILALAGCQMTKIHSSEYVRTLAVDDRWWLEHNGVRFLSLGVNCVLPRDGSKPADGRVYRSAFEHDFPAWVSDATNRLNQWGFNTVGAWSHEPFYVASGMYHTRMLGLGAWGAGDSRLLDVFSPAYAREMDETARRDVAPHALDKMLIGYFVNNELPWYGERGWPTSASISLLSRYLLLPPDAPGRQRAVAFLRDYYHDDFSAFTNEWRADESSFDKVKVLEPRIGLSGNAVAAWAGVVAEQYFKLSAGAVRRYDPNHLVLGARFAYSAPEPVFKACAKYCDVVSVNHYSKSGRFNETLLDAIAAATDKPVMITEFSWRAMENRSDLKNTGGADVTVQTQQDRANAFRLYAEAALRRPYLVGYHWFQYADQPPGGRFDGENSNYGLVDIDDHPYTEVLSAITEINRKAIRLHAESRPAPPYDPTVLAAYRPVSVRGTQEPLSQPVNFADAAASFSTYGDEVAGSWLHAEKAPGGGIRARLDLRKGWGAGIAAMCGACATNSDGSANVLGATRMTMRMRADPGVAFVMTLNESGHGPKEAQTFDGQNGADGEAYNHAAGAAAEGWQEYVFWLRDFERSPHYGNQRGNSVIDMQAVANIGVMFTAPPDAEKSAEIAWIKLE